MPESKKDKTRNKRQASRRGREKQWLAENGWTSWEAIHTALMSGEVKLVGLTHNHKSLKEKEVEKDI